MSGFKLSMLLYDEDPGAKFSSDRLGKAVARFGGSQMHQGFESLDQDYTLQKRKGDLHPYILTYLTALLPGEKLLKHNRVVVSVRIVREHEPGEQRLYTLGPNHYSRHFSPLIGSIFNRTSKQNTGQADGQRDAQGHRLSATNFVANKLQLTGPVPDSLRHRYVGYKPFIDWMFSNSGVAGHILHYSLKKQYRTIYACDKRTVWGVVDNTGANLNNIRDGDNQPRRTTSDGSMFHDPTPESSAALAKQFLDMTSWGEGWKLFTYVITLDSEWRFTETGPEFAIDMLSKHSMHADLAQEIAYSGEFFVRHIKSEDENEDRSHQPSSSKTQSSPEKEPAPSEQRPSADGHIAHTSDHPPSSKNPKDYELVIDNDSGTYRPNKDLLPVFHDWLADPRRLGGLGAVKTMDGFDEELKKMKETRKNLRAMLRKGKGGNAVPERLVPARSGSSALSISSGELDADSISSREVADALQEMEREKGGQSSGA
ncbi:unnamed protein product [Mycena citricolor]|uniref:Uncharacterized protein n=2 Tax=Mycena citricolor TaxID=2018698 RepID=A0AAD2K1K5_9AGAR|nr:unnamed protein product [Mycena citricolor]